MDVEKINEEKITLVVYDDENLSEDESIIEVDEEGSKKKKTPALTSSLSRAASIRSKEAIDSYQKKS